MRKLMWFSVGFAAACAGGAYLRYGIWLALGIICLCALLLGRYRRQMLCALLGCAIGLGWFVGFDRLYLVPAREVDGQAMLLDIAVTDYSRSGDYGIIGQGQTEIKGKTYSIQFYIHEDVSLLPGDQVEGGFYLRYTAKEEKTTYHKGERVFLLCYPKGEHTVTTGISSTGKFLVQNLRKEILSLVDQTFPGDTRSFCRALLLGDTVDMPFEMEWALKTSGIYHIAAVSGMHVSVLFAMLYLLCCKKRVLTAVIGYPMLFLFAAVAGFSPSIVRAAIMQSVMILSLLVNREYDPPTALGAAALVILADNPLAITSVSFQLSVGCMTGIFLFAQPIHEFLMHKTRLGPAKGKGLKAKLTRWFAASISVTLGAISLTTPLSAYYFGSVCVAGILTNLLTLWVVSVIFIGVVAACALGALWLPLGIAVGWAIAWPVRYVLWVIDMVSKVPLSSVYTSSIYIVLWLVLVYVLVTVFRKSKKKHPVVLTVCILSGLIGAVLCSYFEPRMDNYRITAIDVGQGQCLLLQNEGKYYMVDCGGDSDDKAATEAAQLLLSQGIFRLDGLILTHYDADHAGGAEQLLKIIPADTLYLPIQDGENKYRDGLVRKYEKKIHWVKEDLPLEEANLTIFASSDTQDSNESSLCILFQPENCDILITGDRSEKGEQALLEHTTLPDLEILVAGHHGSRTSTSWELLNATKPEIVIVSVGADNDYGHPAWETLERLGLFGCSVYRTDVEGTIIFRG